jgi:hypothetical protein
MLMPMAPYCVYNNGFVKYISTVSACKENVDFRQLGNDAGTPDKKELAQSFFSGVGSILISLAKKNGAKSALGLLR